jgi:hypothetical protein
MGLRSAPPPPAQDPFPWRGTPHPAAAAAASAASAPHAGAHDASGSGGGGGGEWGARGHRGESGADLSAAPAGCGRLEGQLGAARARLADAQREVERFRRSAHDRLLRGELGPVGPGPGGSRLSPRLGADGAPAPAVPPRADTGHQQAPAGAGAGAVPPLALRG